MMNKSEICQLLPHSGTMCLLDKIIAWDKDLLIAQSLSYLNSDNPLYNHQHKANPLPSIHGAEYAAQAMAIHSVLIKHTDSPECDAKNYGAKGYLATIKNIQILADSLLTNNTSALIISVAPLMLNSQGFTYQFNIEKNYQNQDKGQSQAILSGKITIFLL